MANRNFNKKLAIALGVLGIGSAGTLNCVPVSAMEKVISSKEKEEYLETVVQSAVKLGIFSALNDKMMDNAEYKKALEKLCTKDLPMYEILTALYNSQGGDKFVARNVIIQNLILRMYDSEVKNRIKEIASNLYKKFDSKEKIR